ncbi:MAG: DUF2249 domain-containing protein [Bacteroidota bacterium]|nr:DUF2249 domain-containing protein [Bacteroidota bacterium]
MNNLQSKTIDVRNIHPSQRHSLIFEMFDALAGGESIELVNDHEPRPLYYTFLHERTDKFQWEYLESGPTVWRVRIRKH